MGYKIGDRFSYGWVRRTNVVPVRGGKQVAADEPCEPTGTIYFLDESPRSRPSWRFRNVPADHFPCMELALVPLGPDALRRGLRSKAVRGSKRAEYLVEVMAATYEFVLCDCHHELQWVKQSESVCQQIYPKPTVLDKMAAI